jgi:hypothetical protein
MAGERMELAGFERLRYFAPTAICVYLALICAGLIVVSAFLGKLRDARAVTACGVYGLLVSGGLGVVFWRAQRRDLRFEHIASESGEAANFAAVRAAALEAGWSIRREVAPRLLEAQTRGGILESGERVVVRCRGFEVLVASICDPTVGFTLAGRRSCRAHREMIRRVVLNGRPDLEL